MEFKTKDFVLCRDDVGDLWKLDIFSYYDPADTFSYKCISHKWRECIPYEGNERLLGTDSPADAPMEIGGLKVGDKVEVEWDTDKKWYGGEIVRIDLSNRSWVDSEAMPYYVRSECFKYNDGCAWCAARQLRKPKEKKFKFGDKVQWYDEDIKKWRDGFFILDDGTNSIPFLVYTPDDNDTVYFKKDEVRHAEE